MDKHEKKFKNTDEKIVSAFTALLHEKTFEHITVSEVCERAGINRSTFYSHYETLDGCVHALQERIRLLVSERLSVPFGNTVVQEKNALNRETTAALLSVVEEHKAILKSLGKIDAIVTRDRILSEKAMSRLILAKFPQLKTQPSKVRYISVFYTSAMLNFIGEWIKNDCDIPLEDLIDILEACLAGNGGG